MQTMSVTMRRTLWLDRYGLNSDQTGFKRKGRKEIGDRIDTSKFFSKGEQRNRTVAKGKGASIYNVYLFKFSAGENFLVKMTADSSGEREEHCQNKVPQQVEEIESGP